MPTPITRRSVLIAGTASAVSASLPAYAAADVVKLAAITRTVFYVPLWVAMHRGFLKDQNLDVQVTFFDNAGHTDEMLRTGTGPKTGRRMGHMPIDGEGGALQALDGLNARRIFVHINNTNPIQIDGSPERKKVEAAGWEVAEDGMEIVL